MKVAIAQVNTRVGDLKNNSAKILEYIQKARQSGADLVVFFLNSRSADTPLKISSKRKLLLRKMLIR